MIAIKTLHANKVGQELVNRLVSELHDLDADEQDFVMSAGNRPMSSRDVERLYQLCLKHGV